MIRETKQRQEKLTMASYWQIVTSLLFFRFLANLRQFGSRIADAYSIEVTFLLTTTFYLTQTENRTKKSYTTFPWLLWVKVLFLPKNTDISKIKSALALTRYIFVNLRTRFQVSSMPVITAPSNSKRTPKKPTQIGVKMHNENICRIAIY